MIGNKIAGKITSLGVNCVLCNLFGSSIFTITDAKLYVPIVTLSTEDNAKLSKLLREGFKRPVYWKKYKIISNKTYDENDYIRELLEASYQRVKRLFVLAYRDRNNAYKITVDSHRKEKIENYNIEIDGINVYDHPVND